MSPIPSVTLNNGQQMPILGLGTYSHEGSGDREKVYQAIRDAIKAGYRHIDTASVYEIEDEVGRAINDALTDGDVKREELFVTTKLWLRWLRRDKVLPALKESLNKLKLSYVDLYLVHWPMAFKPADEAAGMEPDTTVNIHTDTWPAMEEALEQGLTKAIGVSNYNSQQIDELLKVAKIKPVINQFESHPFLSQRRLIDHCEAHGIKVTAYSPLGGSPTDVDKEAQRKPNSDPDLRRGLFDNELIKNLATKYGKTIGQILIKYQVSRGVIVIPKSVTKSRIIENSQVFDFEFTADELKQLEQLNKNHRYIHVTAVFGNHPNYPFTIEF